MGFPMPSWYDIVGLDSRSNELCDGLDESMNCILNLINDEVKENNIDYSRIVLSGFSQGGALALYTGMTCNRPSHEGLGLAGIVIMSGYLPRSSSFQVAEGSQFTPILHCHGKDDPMVVVDAVELSKNRVSEMTVEMGGRKDLYQTKIYPGLEHSVSMEELEDVAQFLERVVPKEDGAACDSDSNVDPSAMSVKELRDAIKRAGLDDQANGMFEKSDLVNLIEQNMKRKRK
jgi:predicted esterase